MNALTQQTTLSSRELVEIINSIREEGQAELRHDTFLKKVKHVLGGSHEKFLGTYLDRKNEERPCYYLPKRECYLMVMSEGYKAQAIVYDKIAELEEKNKKPETKLERLKREIKEEEERLCIQEENSKLNLLLDHEFGYCSILRAAAFLGVSEKVFDWSFLESETLRFGLEVKKLHNPRHRHQNLYPIKAFEWCYPEYDFDDLEPENLEDKEKVIVRRVK